MGNSSASSVSRVLRRFWNSLGHHCRLSLWMIRSSWSCTSVVKRGDPGPEWKSGRELFMMRG